MLIDPSIWITSENALVVDTILSKEVLNILFLIILLYFKFDLNCFRSKSFQAPILNSEEPAIANLSHKLNISKVYSIDVN